MILQYVESKLVVILICSTMFLLIVANYKCNSWIYTYVFPTFSLGAWMECLEQL